MRIPINVTARDIEAGEPSLVSFCPIALALKRAMPNADLGTVGVGISRFWFKLNGEEWSGKLSKAKSDWIMHYDDGDDVMKPFAGYLNAQKVTT